MAVFSKKGESKNSPVSEKVSEINVGVLKNAEDELDTSKIKVPAFPGTEKRVKLRAKEKTQFGHEAGDEFDVAELNAEKILKTGKYEKVQ